MADAPRILEVGDDGFYEQVLMRSHELPVVVDFWAPWCGPCRQLAPVLDRVLADSAGAFTLVKVNIDESPAVAQQYGVQSIPLLVGFRDGQPVAQLLGLQPEGAVRELVRQLAPSDADRLAAEADRLADGGEASAAEARYREALELEPRHGRALLGLARRLGERGEIEEALTGLRALVGDPALEAEADRLAATLRMRASAGADPDELRARVDASPDDLKARLDLGRTLAAAGQHEPALEALLEVVRRDPAFEEQAARRAMLDLFEVLGSSDPLTRRFRGELARAIFR